MENLDIKVKALNQLILQGDSITAIETYYAEEVTMQENEDVPRVGKQTCIEHEQLNLKRVTQLQSKLIHQAIDPIHDVVFSEWELTFDSVSGKRYRLNEVSVQHWHLGKIIKEKFYYKEMVIVNG